MHWDVFCRVVDNFGDVGFGWRLAADLGARGERVRFWLDDQSALSWMAPHGASGVSVGSWSDAAGVADPAAVVVETFGCGLPPRFAAAMAARTQPPLWINVEYLSAEAVVERNHGLPSPQTGGPAAGLTRWFFYPGFTERTGGLLRDPGLRHRQERFKRDDWLVSIGLGRVLNARPQVRLVSLFCYEQCALAGLLDSLAVEPTWLLAAAGTSTRELTQALGPGLERGALQIVFLPPLSQLDYDHLLWACDMNFVRGEDSFVRAQWAGVPFVWQIYPQQDQAHTVKLDAFVDRFLVGASTNAASGIRRLFSAWNGMDRVAPLPERGAWTVACQRWREHLFAQSDLGSRLIAFAGTKLLK